MSELIAFAKRELELLGGKDDPIQQSMNQCILDIVETFSKQGHSGFSASYAVGIIEKLLRYEPIKPLTGEDSEWSDTHDGKLLQNIRCFHVFKEKETGRTYDAEGKIFRYPDGVCVTRSDSHVDVTFPYTPKREYIDVKEAA